MKEKPSDGVRLDKWLWAARFYKTRALAREMVDGGKVHYNGQRSKPSKLVELNATLTLRQGNDERTVVIKAITEQRRPASEAVLLYEETAESVEKREKTALARKMNALTMPHPDQLHRYLFEQFAVRGELVTVSETWKQILENHNYPLPVKTLLGELLVATSLLTATLKFAGDITVQLQGDGPMTLAVINGNNQQQMRGVARVQGDVPENADLKTLVGNGFLVITISPEEGERYQGVVGLEGDTLAACLEDYFMRSEQLPTRLFIRTGEVDGQPAAGGMLLQVLPAQDAQTNDFEHLTTLTETIKAEELFNLSATDVLWRLYHEEEVTVYDPQSVEFKCTCSRERCAGALKTLPDEEIDSIMAEDGEIDMHCDYCGTHYVFNSMDIAEIRNNASPADPQVH